MQPPTPECLSIWPLLSSLGSDVKIAYFRRNQTIFSKGDPSDSIFYIQKGSVKLTVTSRQGKEAVLAVLAMLRLLHKDEDVCDAVISSLTRLKTTIIGNLGDNLLYSSEERLARALLWIAELYEQPERRPFPKLSQQDLANMIGTTRQRVNFFLRRFQKSGFVDYGDGLRVHSSIAKVVGKD